MNGAVLPDPRALPVGRARGPVTSTIRIWPVARGTLAPNGVASKATVLLTYAGSQAHAVIVTPTTAAYPVSATISGTRGRIELTPFTTASRVRLRTGGFGNRTQSRRWRRAESASSWSPPVSRPETARTPTRLPRTRIGRAPSPGAYLVRESPNASRNSGWEPTS